MPAKTGLDALLRPEDSILVLIDHQPYQFTNLNSHEPTMIINNVIGLAKTAKVFNVPTILTTVIEERGGYIIKGLQDVFPEQKPIDRTFINTWEDPKVTDIVKKSGRKQLVLAALWTEICLAMPAIQALAEGYDVFIVTDASGGVSLEAHDMAVRRMVAAGAVPITWLAVLGEWQRDWAREKTAAGVSAVVLEHGGASAVALAWELQLLAGARRSRAPDDAMPTTPAPIRIGYCLSLTGPVADNSRSARLAHDIWREDVNRRGGLLGRPVELICYDDHADASRVPGLYQRLMDEDRVDLVIGGYGTNTILPAMPLIMERQRFFVGLMGLGVNNALAYPNYFAMIPTGPDPNAALTEGFFALAAEQKPRPATVALVSADAEFSRNPILGAKANAEKYGFRIVHEATYPLTTEDFTPVIDAVAERDCDLLFLCSYLADSIGLVRAIHAHRFRPKMVGGAMIGPQNTAVKTDARPAAQRLRELRILGAGP